MITSSGASRHLPLDERSDEALKGDEGKAFFLDWKLFS
jgi:hypothetical protein